MAAELEQDQELQLVAKRISPRMDLSQNPTRRFIREGHLVKVSRKKDITYNFVLFSDLLLYCTETEIGTGSLKVHKSLPFDRYFDVVDIPKGSPKYGHSVFEVHSTVKSFLVVAKSPSAKSEWYQCIRQLLDETPLRREAAISEADAGSVLKKALPVFVPNDFSDYCMLQKCWLKFDFMRRKHHCRYCGKLVCSDCSKKKLPDLAEDSTAKVRVCDVCFLRHRKFYAAAVSTKKLKRAHTLWSVDGGMPVVGTALGFARSFISVAYDEEGDFDSGGDVSSDDSFDATQKSGTYTVPLPSESRTSVEAPETRKKKKRSAPPPPARMPHRRSQTPPELNWSPTISGTSTIATRPILAMLSSMSSESETERKTSGKISKHIAVIGETEKAVVWPPPLRCSASDSVQSAAEEKAFDFEKKKKTKAKRIVSVPPIAVETSVSTVADSSWITASSSVQQSAVEKKVAEEYFGERRQKQKVVSTKFVATDTRVSKTPVVCTSAAKKQRQFPVATTMVSKPPKHSSALRQNNAATSTRPMASSSSKTQTVDVNAVIQEYVARFSKKPSATQLRAHIAKTQRLWVNYTELNAALKAFEKWPTAEYCALATFAAVLADGSHKLERRRSASFVTFAEKKKEAPQRRAVQKKKCKAATGSRKIPSKVSSMTTTTAETAVVTAAVKKKTTVRRPVSARWPPRVQTPVGTSAAKKTASRKPPQKAKKTVPISVSKKVVGFGTRKPPSVPRRSKSKTALGTSAAKRGRIERPVLKAGVTFSRRDINAAIEEYLEQFSKLPTATQLCAYIAKTRGVSVKYSRVNAALAAFSRV